MPDTGNIDISGGWVVGTEVFGVTGRRLSGILAFVKPERSAFERMGRWGWTYLWLSVELSVDYLRYRNPLSEVSSLIGR